jgi:RHS repeat-associated protein
LTLGAGQSGDVWTTFSVSGAELASGTLTLKATAQDAPNPSDTGYYAIQVAPAGPVVERGLCLTIAAGPAAAYECGDLRLVHTLPAVRTLNKTRAPTLLYNSQQAHPYPLVQADVTLPAGDPLPTTITAILRVANAQYSSSWSGSTWGSPGESRRVTVGFDADALATGLYADTLVIQRLIGSTYDTLKTIIGSLPIVNRKGSPFGPGWWLAGFEKLYFNVPPGQVLWVGGDGSVRRYMRGGTVGTDTAYIAKPVDSPDSLIHLSNGRWVRLLSDGAKVKFTSAGTHDSTTNRLGYSTVFVDSSGSPGILTRINLPPSTSNLAFSFAYTGTPARLSSVSAPDSAVGTSRVTTLNWAGDSVSITDPGTSAPVVFRYQTGGTNRIVARKDRRGGLTSFAYDAGYRLASSTRTGDDIAPIVFSFCAAEVRGLATCSPTLVKPESAYAIFDGPRTDVADLMHFWVSSYGAPWKLRDAFGAITILDRADSSWPALVTRAQYPNGRITSATYDGRGNIKTSTDSSLYVTGQHAITRYQWDQKWDNVTEIIVPTGQVTHFGYDATNGNRLWQEDGRGSTSRVNFAYYTSGSGAGLLKTVTLPGGARDSVAYDSQGNLTKGVSAVDDTTFTVVDRIGRPTILRSPIGQGMYRSDTTYYDQASRPIRTASYGPAINGAAAAQLNVQSFYNPEGALDSLKRWSTPDPAGVGTITTSWRYDLAGRRRVEVAPDLASDTTGYDPAGNPVRLVTRRGKIITMAYDAMNHLILRAVPGDTYPSRTVGIATMSALSGFPNHPYPYYPSDSSADPLWGGTGVWDYKIAADTAIFAYDLMGNLLCADNNNAKVRRTYFKDGRVKTDTSKVRNWISWLFPDTTNHVYGLTYQYDLSGRLISLQHPQQLTPTPSANTARYEYDPVTGMLSAVVDPLGNRFEYTYNLRNELIRLKAPTAGITDTMSYDLAGRLLTEKLRNQSTSGMRYVDSVLRQFTLTYADPERVASASNTWGWKDTTITTYSGLGQVVSFRYWAPGTAGGLDGVVTNTSTTTLDALGNAYQNKDSNNVWYDNHTWTQDRVSEYPRRYGPLAGGRPTGRLRASNSALPGQFDDRRDTTVYDAAGNTEFSYQPWSDLYAPLQDRAYYYGPDGTLRAAETRNFQKAASCCETNSWNTTFEEYRYDALGRRIVVRTRRMSDAARDGAVATPTTMHTLRRTIWAGDQELYEIQAYAGAAWDYANYRMEEDTSFTFVSATGPSPHIPAYFDPNPRLGRVAYTYGPGIDMPLSAIRIKYVDTVQSKPRVSWASFALVPWWNWRGRADRGTLADGGAAICQPPPNGSRCVGPSWQVQPFAMAQQPADSQAAWFGTLLRDKEDGTGTLHRRNRYVDPQTGRFTQEDPIGLAGGLNLYGFAAGDPVNFSDPFGLCARGLVNLGLGYCARVDAFGEQYEIHVFRGDAEIGIFGRNGWISRHGFRGTPSVPRSVLNKLNGENAVQMRARNLMAPKGEEDIRAGRYSPGVSRLFNRLNSVAIGATILGAYLDIREAEELGIDPWTYMTLRMQGLSYNEIRRRIIRIDLGA